MSKKNILYRFSMALMFMCLFYSCMQKEESENSLAGIVEFVARPTNYNGQNVGTKATSVSDFENKIHNCYFLLFNNDGALTFISEDLGNTLTTQRFSKQQLQQLGGGNLDSYTNSTACFIANVPKDVVESIKTLEQLNGTVLDIAYSSADVIDTEESNKNSFFVVPEFDLDNDENTPSVQCIPMLGMTTCNLKTTDLFQISLKRLFAKISVNLSVTQNLSSFDLLAAHLYNLPTKVNLTEPTDPASYESLWVKDASAFVVSQIEGPIDDDAISAGALGVGNSSYKFYFYAPEYYLQPLASTTENYGNERYKPRMYDNSPDNPKYPIYIKLFGTYKDESVTGNTVKSDVKYDLYLGENASTNFTLKRNVHYTNNVIIKGITNNIEGTGETLDCRVEITTLDMVEILGQTANCYIIGKTGTYIYPACKGVFKGGLENIPESLLCSNSEGKTLELVVLKNDNSSNKITNLAYNPESKEFSFDITEMDGGTGASVSNDGNIILALKCKETGEIEWSWHLWIINGSLMGSEGFFEMTTQTYPNGYNMMDRNLGARPTALQKNTAGVVTGLYYKYGHKEPFIDGAYYGGGESATYDWSGTDKAQTDPCPPGYRVPASDIWKKGSSATDPTASHYSNVLAGDAFNFWDMAYYPYSGYIDANGASQSIGSTAVGESQYMASVKLPHEQTPWDMTPTYGDIIRPNYPQQFLNVNYRINDIDVAGYSSTKDGTLFKYWYKNQGVEIINCTFQRGTWVQSGPWYNRKYNAYYTGNYLLINENLTGEELEKKYSTEYSKLIERIQVIRAGNVLDNYLNSLQIEVSYNLDENTNTSYGYQVRCVKE